jgi:hypothetical protein
MGFIISDRPPEWSHAALLVNHLDSPNPDPRALPEAIQAGSAVIW